MADYLLTLIVLGAACSAVSVTVAKTFMFRRLRSLISSRSETVGHLVECHYCLGHWVALILVALAYAGGGSFIPGPLWFIVSWLAVTAVSGIAAQYIMGKN